MPTFKKNDRVALVTSWDNKGTVQIRRAIVHSWGAKIARMQDPTTNEMFKFEIGTGRFDMWQNVVADQSDAELERIALAAGAEIVAAERARMEQALAHYGDSAGAGYVAAVNKSLSELHEPRVRWRGAA